MPCAPVSPLSPVVTNDAIISSKLENGDVVDDAVEDISIVHQPVLSVKSEI